MNRFEKPMISVSFFEAENIVTVSGVEDPNTYAAYQLNKAMFENKVEVTTTVLEFN